MCKVSVRQLGGGGAMETILCMSLVPRGKVKAGGTNLGDNNLIDGI